jgi:glycosyltransferase involved in cell wall biosynthesis
MKLTYIANNRLPTEKAHGLQIAKTCEAFLKQDVNLLLVIPRRHQPTPLKKKSIKNYYGLKKSIPTSKLPCLDFLLIRSQLKLPTFLGQFAFWLQSSTFYFMATMRAMFRGGIFYSRDIPALLPLVLMRKNCYYEGHNFPKTRIGHKLYEFVLKRTKGVVVITHQLKKLYKEKFNLSDDQIVVAPDGVDLDVFSGQNKSSSRKSLNLPASQKLIVYTGNLYPWKGVYTLVESAKHLKSKDVTLVLVGGDVHDGAYEKLAAFAQQQGVQNLIMTGHVHPSQIPGYLAAADLLVIPNSAQNKMSASYTSPLKMFEYMAAKRPIVASSVPALKEVLNPENAAFFKPDNAADLAKTLDDLLKNSTKRTQLADQSYKDVSAYTWDTRTSKIVDFLNL